MTVKTCTNPSCKLEGHHELIQKYNSMACLFWTSNEVRQVPLNDKMQTIFRKCISCGIDRFPDDYLWENGLENLILNDNDRYICTKDACSIPLAIKRRMQIGDRQS